MTRRKTTDQRIFSLTLSTGRWLALSAAVAAAVTTFVRRELQTENELRELRQAVERLDAQQLDRRLIVLESRRIDDR